MLKNSIEILRDFIAIRLGIKTKKLKVNRIRQIMIRLRDTQNWNKRKQIKRFKKFNKK